MKDLNNIIDRIKDLFPDIHVEIEKHVVIGGEYEVSCYGIHENRSDKLVSFIYDHNDELYPNYEIELIPILYTKEETREHFPAIADQLLIESISRGLSAQRFLPSQDMEWPTNPCVCLSTPAQSPNYATGNSSETWPINPVEMTATDETYANAA